MIPSTTNKSSIQCRLICIGNQLVPGDCAGPLIFEALSGRRLPRGVELIDGGLGGLNLLGLCENTRSVIFIDAIKGFGPAPSVRLFALPDEEICGEAYDHNAGLGYLMSVAPNVLTPPLPRFYLIGIEGEPTPELCTEAVQTCCQLVDQLQSDHTTRCAD